MLKVYGFGVSFPANKVRMCTNALELEHEYININLMAGEQKSEDFLKVNPKGKVPAISDNGFCLSESDAIMRYLAQKTGKLYSEDYAEQAQIDEWVNFISGHIGMAMAKIMFNTVFAPMLGIEVDERSLSEGHKFLDQYLPAVEEQLSSSNYLAGDSLTIADVSLVATLDPATVLKLDFSSYPALSKYLEAHRASTWYQNCHKYFGEGILDK